MVCSPKGCLRATTSIAVTPSACASSPPKRCPDAALHRHSGGRFLLVSHHERPDNAHRRHRNAFPSARISPAPEHPTCTPDELRESGLWILANAPVNGVRSFAIGGARPAATRGGDVATSPCSTTPRRGSGRHSVRRIRPVGNQVNPPRRVAFRDLYLQHPSAQRKWRIRRDGYLRGMPPRCSPSARSTTSMTTRCSWRRAGTPRATRPNSRSIPRASTASLRSPPRWVASHHDESLTSFRVAYAEPRSEPEERTPPWQANRSSRTIRSWSAASTTTPSKSAACC